MPNPSSSASSPDTAGADPNEPRVSWWKTNQAAGVYLSAVLLAILAHIMVSEGSFEQVRDGFNLSFFPILAIVFCLLCTGSMIFDGSRKKVMEEMMEFDGKARLFVGSAFLLCFVYLYITKYIGLALGGLIFLFIVMYQLGLRPIQTVALTSLAVAVVVFVIFALIGVTIPILPEWFTEAYLI